LQSLNKRDKFSLSRSVGQQMVNKFYMKIILGIFFGCIDSNNNAHTTEVTGF